MKRFFIAAFVLLPFGIQAQNLIRNSSFETHAALQCLNCNLLFGKYPGIMYHWDNAGWGCVICDENYRRNSDDIKAGMCPFDKVKPKDGKTMIEMRYMPTCGGNIHEGADYLCARTTQPMKVGELYEVSLWIFIEAKKRSDPDWAKHIGIMLLPQNLKMHGLYETELILPFLPIDTVIYDTWYPVKWRIRPLCTSNYLMIGVFEDQVWHQNRSYVDVKYWLDLVSVTEIPSAKAVADSSIYYCSKYDPVALGIPPMIDRQTLLFQNDAFALSAEHKTLLDTFAVLAKKYPDIVFELSGHTDSIGSKNQVLSEKRAQSVFQYLTERHQIPAFRFIILAKGSKDPAQPNHTEAGRAQNRRAQIRQSELDISNAFYRSALQALAEKRYPEVYSFLNKWLIKQNPKESPAILLFDPRFEQLHKDPRWKSLEQKLRNTYRSLKFLQYAFQLDSMRLAELCATAELTLFGYRKGFNALPGYVPDLDTVFFEMVPQPGYAIRRIRSSNYAILSGILNRTGWPKKSEWGESATASAFAIFMQEPNLADYLKWLPELKKRCEEGEAPWIYYARLYDQCNLGLGEPQRYATDVLYFDDGTIRVKPWEGDVDSVNEQRAKIGLPLLPPKVADAMRR